MGALAGVLLLAGLWTPLAGVLVAIVEAWIAFSAPKGAAFPAIIGILGASLAMIGPGAWSLDAWLFGRKHINPPKL
jgi:putative oxidoreductase